MDLFPDWLLWFWSLPPGSRRIVLVLLLLVGINLYLALLFILSRGLGRD